MPRRDETDLKLTVPATTWLPEPLARRMDHAARGLGWTNSQVLRWSLGQVIARLELAVGRRQRLSAPPAKNGNGKHP